MLGKSMACCVDFEFETCRKGSWNQKGYLCVVWSLYRNCLVGGREEESHCISHGGELVDMSMGTFS